jgi:hypothetical protein
MTCIPLMIPYSFVHNKENEGISSMYRHFSYLLVVYQLDKVITILLEAVLKLNSEFKTQPTLTTCLFHQPCRKRSEYLVGCLLLFYLVLLTQRGTDRCRAHRKDSVTPELITSINWEACVVAMCILPLGKRRWLHATGSWQLLRDECPWCRDSESSRHVVECKVTGTDSLFALAVSDHQSDRSRDGSTYHQSFY